MPATSRTSWGSDRKRIYPRETARIPERSHQSGRERARDTPLVPPPFGGRNAIYVCYIAVIMVL